MNKENKDENIYQIGDELTLDIMAFNGKEKIKKWERKNIKIKLGNDNYIKGFDELLIGQEIKDYYSLDFKYENTRLNEMEDIHFEVHNKIDLLKDVSGDDKASKKDLKKLKEKVKEQEKEIEALEKLVASYKSEEEKNKFLIATKELEFKDKIHEVEKKMTSIIDTKVSEQKNFYEQKASEEKKYAAQKLLESILPIINNIELASQWGLKSENQEVKNYVSGFTRLLEQLYSALQDSNIFKIDPNIGDTYNPENHEILETTQSSEFSDEQILAVKAPGFMLHDRVIIPAKIVIVKNNQ
ncbi:nucleotide exchange factor GrpE [Mycoplasmopsis agassizii]|nr:nucleotide exchange factor GrpE [Mycoplasmopsis agassizii]SMC17067.1 molecular chaperone GrpE [Mycoplasmopsis agassizii]